MKLKRILGTVTAVVALIAAVILYTVHPVKSSDHQDTYNLATRSNTSADITDVYVFPAPDNPNNVVFAMNVSPLILPGQGTSKFFDPTLLWQFKISHQTSGIEDQVIQITASGAGAGQKLNLYGPAAATSSQVGTSNTVIGGAPTGSIAYNNSGSFQNGTVQFFAGPRSDPFFFDLFALFTFLGDRNYGTHTSQSDPGPESASNPEGLSNGDVASNLSGLAPPYDQTGNSPGPNPPAQASFNGFTAGTMSTSSGGNGGALGAYACSTNPASDTLNAGPFNVLSLVVEVPISLLTTGFSSSKIHVWATTSSTTGS
jgi:hypothetical protein